MTAADLAGAAEILGRLAVVLDQPGKDGRVRVPFNHEFFGALQKLFRGTQWHGRFCWEHVGAMQDASWYDARGKFHHGDSILVVDVTPIPREIACAACGGRGHVPEARR